MRDVAFVSIVEVASASVEPGPATQIHRATLFKYCTVTSLERHKASLFLSVNAVKSRASTSSRPRGPLLRLRLVHKRAELGSNVCLIIIVAGGRRVEADLDLRSSLLEDAL